MLDSEAAIGYPTATKAMMGGYAAKTFFHACLGLYMLYWNRRWNRQARERGEDLSEEERAKRAEEIGMVCSGISLHAPADTGTAGCHRV